MGCHLDVNTMGFKKRGGCYEYQEVAYWRHMLSDDDFRVMLNMFGTEIS